MRQVDETTTPPPPPPPPSLPSDGACPTPLKQRRLNGGRSSRGSRRQQLSGAKVDQLLGLRRTVGGTLQYHVAAEGLPGGPANLGELLTWPTIMVQQYLFSGHDRDSRARRTRLLSLWEEGLVVHSDCSGKLTPEATLVLLRHSLFKHGVSFPEEVLFFWRACDLSKVCQTVIQGSTSHSPVHLFTGLLERLPEEHMQQVVALRPAPCDTKEDRAAAFERMGAYLRDHASKMYGPAMTAENCMYHPNGQCAVKFQSPGYLSEAMRPLTLMIAGPSCRPWSLFAGGTDPKSHDDLECWLLWISEIARAEYDIVIMENSEHFPVEELFTTGMPKHYCVKYAKWGSQEQGWPVRRTRAYCVAINMRTCLWVGGYGEEDGNVLKDFLSHFGAACTLEGDLFCGLDSEESRDEVMSTLAQKRGMYLRAEQLARFRDQWPTLLPPCASAAYEQACELYRTGSRVGLAGSLNADISQSAARLRSGPWVPTLARSTQLCCMNKNRLFTPNEVDACMGWPAISRPENLDLVEVVGLQRSLAKVSQAARRSLAGNGMMLPQIMSWLLYVFSHVARRQRLEALCMPLRVAAQEGDDSDSEDL